jgi:MFS family permease
MGYYKVPLGQPSPLHCRLTLLWIFLGWLGRRDAIWYSCVFWLIGTFLQTAVQDWKMLVAGRIINGLTVGVTSSQVPVYLAEISKVETRGSIIMTQRVAINVGFTIYFFVGYGCSFIPGPALSEPHGVFNLCRLLS